MKRALVAGTALALLAIPAGAVAMPTETDQANAAQECRAERGTTDATREAFRTRYGTNKKGKNAFGKCVSRRSKDEQSEQQAATANASQECKAERAANPQAFAERYGTNRNRRNAFGKCVSGKAKADKDQADREDAEKAEERRKAAKECAAERRASGRDAFADKYGTNRNKRNAFGKCVSRKANS